MNEEIQKLVELENTMRGGMLAVCILLLVLFVVVFIPAKYDPAIRLREWLNNKDEDNGGN